MSENPPFYGKPQPTDEAKASAVHMRRCILSVLEAAIENDWDRVEQEATMIAMLARHCKTQERGSEIG